MLFGIVDELHLSFNFRTGKQMNTSKLTFFIKFHFFPLELCFFLFESLKTAQKEQIASKCIQKLNFTKEQHIIAVYSNNQNPSVERMCFIGCILEELKIVSLFCYGNLCLSLVYTCCIKINCFS